VDLITLVAACALTADPKLMHALIWHQSGGEPWSFSVPGKRQPFVYHSAQDAVVEAHRSAPAGIPIRIGLTGLAVDAGSATLAMFMPCPNISMAARQITRLSERCKASASFTGDSIHCAIATYRGSWDRPDNKFADAVLASVAKGDAPNFDMSDEVESRADAVAAVPSIAGHRVSTAGSTGLDDQEQAWSSALFPARSKQVSDTSSNSPAADRLQESRTLSAHPMAAPSHDDGLFVRRVPERRPQ
jgi:hypothetical protein